MESPDPQNPGLIMGPGPEGCWDSERVSGPRVLRGSDGVWRMWYYGRDPSFDRDINLPTGRCGMATSDDGVHWERIAGPLTGGAVLEPHGDVDRFDSSHVAVSDVSYADGRYWMWYFGGSQARQSIGKYEVRGFDMLPGLALSGDGLHWFRVEGPYRGALLDHGEPGDFDAVFCGWPQVLRDASGWRMYYHSLDPMRGFVVGMARSGDGLRWEKYGEVLGPGESGAFDEQGVATRQVVQRGGTYYMFYEGVRTSGQRSIGLAISEDGIAWRRQPGSEADGSVFSHAPSGSGRWDAFAVGTPCVVEAPEGGLWLYYIGSNEAGDHQVADEMSLRHQIGLACCDGDDLTRWRRLGEA